MARPRRNGSGRGVRANRRKTACLTGKGPGFGKGGGRGNGSNR